MLSKTRPTRDIWFSKSHFSFVFFPFSRYIVFWCLAADGRTRLILLVQSLGRHSREDEDGAKMESDGGIGGGGGGGLPTRRRRGATQSGDDTWRAQSQLTFRPATLVGNHEAEHDDARHSTPASQTGHYITPAQF
jgi:hypothetical protein